MNDVTITASVARFFAAGAIVLASLAGCAKSDPQAEAAKKLSDPAYLAHAGQAAWAAEDARRAKADAEYDKLKAGRFSYSDEFPMYGCRTVFNPDGSVTHYSQGNHVFDPKEDPERDLSCRGIDRTSDHAVPPDAAPSDVAPAPGPGGATSNARPDDYQ